MTYFPSPVFCWRYTPSLFTTLPFAPVRFLHVNVLLLYYPVAVLFVLCLAICSLCSVLSSATRKVLVLSLRLPKLLHALVVSNLCFACFASQTPRLSSAIPSAPIKFVARLCCILLYSVIFCFACFASQTSGLCSAFPSAPVKSVTRFCYSGHLRHDYLIRYAYFDRMLFRTAC